MDSPAAAKDGDLDGTIPSFLHEVLADSDEEGQEVAEVEVDADDAGAQRW